MQVRDSLKMYNNLVERCFKECAEDMRSKALTSSEEKVRSDLSFSFQQMNLPAFVPPPSLSVRFKVL
jgi:import inner membrane translocase subunit TIM9